MSLPIVPVAGFKLLDTACLRVCVVPTFVPDAPTPTALGTATFVTYESNYYSVMPGEGVEPSSQRPTKHPWHHLAVTPVHLGVRLVPDGFWL